MNTTILQQYNLEFVYHNLGGAQIWGESWLAPYLYIHRDPIYIQDFINAIDLAISDNYDQLGELFDWSGSDEYTIDTFFFAEIRDDGNFYIHEKGFEHERNMIIPLEDWREILISWKEFIENYS